MAARGWRIAGEGGFDLLVLGVMLPGMSGLAIARQLRAQRDSHANPHVDGAGFDAEGLGMTLRRTNLSELVDSVVQQNAALAHEKGVTLRAVTAEQPVVASADESGVRRILLILVDNALKHTPEGGAVTVSAAAAAGGSILAVEDTGEGISAAALPHIFERFYRADPARGSGSGFGLRLSIAQAIAQAHGSAIEVSSPPGAGAQFSLPLKR